MDQDDHVRSLIATMLMVPLDRVEAQTSLRSLDNSLAGTRLRLGLKRIGIAETFQKIPATFGALQRSLLGVAASAQLDPVGAKPQVIGAPAGQEGLEIGHDIQDIHSLPDTVDYWSHEFYVGAFSPAELAYAVALSEPKEHFAGFWAAKEALKKCDRSFIDVEFRELTVAHNTDGSPYFLFGLPIGKVRLMHALSISHAANTASAVVLSPAGGGI